MSLKFKKTKENFICDPSSRAKLTTGQESVTSSKFIKNVENFVCERCGTHVQGNGYTNHCPQCLWSKHVDIFPGDRKGNCGGMMEPIRVEKKGKEYIIIHKCQKCGLEKPNKTVSKDNFEMVIQISAENF